MKLFFACDSDTQLLPHFLKHYRGLGFTQFYCSSTDSGLKSQGDLFVIPHCRNSGLGYFPSLQRAFVKLIRETAIADNEWYGVTELDEFHHYDQPIADLVAKFDAANCDAVFGKLIDRVAADGSLPELRADIPIHQQFPRTSTISGAILGACPQKVMLIRGYKQVDGGNHSLSSPHKQWHTYYTVNHFKWHANILKRLRERVAMPTDHGDGWLAGNRKVLEHWNKTRSVLV